MSEYCVVVADAGRARLFTLEAARDPETESGPRLVERKGFVNPEKSLPDHEVSSDAKSMRSRNPQGGSAHGYDDHRAAHELEVERRFAKQVAREAEILARAEQAGTVILAAQSHMTGHLRRELEGFAKAGLTLRELAASVSKLTPSDIQEHLVKAGLLPPCRRPTGRA